MKLDLFRPQLIRIIHALEWKAHDEAGHSQAPNLIDKERTPEWQDAQQLRALLRAEKKRTKAPPL